MANGAISANSWLLDWLETQGACSQADVEALFESDRRRRQFRSFLDSVPLAWPTVDVNAGASIAAGSGADLSGSMGSCGHSDCLIKEVDALVQRTWHYFDRVVVAGPSSLTLASIWDADVDRGVKRVAYYAEALQYIRDIGAAEFIVLSQKPPACNKHLSQHAGEAGMADLLEDDDRWADRLLPETDCRVEWRGSYPKCADSHWEYSLNHPALEHTRWGSVHAPEGAESSEIVRLALVDAYRDHLANLVTDVKYARRAGSALGAVAPVHEDILQARPSMAVSESDVAFELPLPVLNGVSPRDLLALREEHYDSFEVFRGALRQAINERLKLVDQEGPDAIAIAVEIADDVISPALAKIGNEMRATERLLSRSGGLTVGVTAIGTTVGLLLHAPVVIGPLLGAAVAGVDLRKFWSDKKDVELTDMYFLWRIAGLHARKRR
jgi:hypothetical protein